MCVCIAIPQRDTPHHTHHTTACFYTSSSRMDGRTDGRFVGFKKCAGMNTANFPEKRKTHVIFLSRDIRAHTKSHIRMTITTFGCVTFRCLCDKRAAKTTISFLFLPHRLERVKLSQSPARSLWSSFSKRNYCLQAHSLAASQPRRLLFSSPPNHFLTQLARKLNKEKEFRGAFHNNEYIAHLYVRLT